MERERAQSKSRRRRVFPKQIRRAQACGARGARQGVMPLLNPTLGMIPLHGNDVWLHGMTAVIAAYFGWRQPSAKDRRHILGDRRQRMHPIARERRFGLADRREGFGGMSPA